MDYIIAILGHNRHHKDCWGNCGSDHWWFKTSWVKQLFCRHKFEDIQDTHNKFCSKCNKKI